MKVLIPKGKHYDFNLLRLWYRFIPFRYKEGRVIVFEGRIFTEPYDIRPDSDQGDIHKFCGINLNGYKASDVNAVMLGFQADPEKQSWNLTIYGNEDKAFTFRSLFPSKAGDLIRVEFKLLSRNSIEVTIYLNSEKVAQTPYVYIWNNASIRFPVLILPWHGGKDNDGNGIGGVAPVDLRLELKIYKQ